MQADGVRGRLDMNLLAPAAELVDAFAAGVIRSERMGGAPGTRGNGMNLHVAAPADVESLKRRVG